jgi:hypothetical protein
VVAHKPSSKYFWCHDHARPRRFHNDSQLEAHRLREHEDKLPAFEENDTPWDLARLITCDVGSCKATFMTEKMKEEHKRRFHTPLW